MGKASTPVFLSWVRGLLTGQLNQDPDADFIKRLDHEIERSRTLRANLAQNQDTYQLIDVGEGGAPGLRLYRLAKRGRGGWLTGAVLTLNQQQADDLGRQLDAPIDYFND